MEIIILIIFLAVISVLYNAVSVNKRPGRAPAASAGLFSSSWRPSRSEIVVKYNMYQRKLYMSDSRFCIYPQYHGRVGINKKGRNFPVMVTRKHFEDKGYAVLKDYLLVRCPRQRETHEGFHFLCNLIGEDKLRTVIREARGLKGGDPDLFVYKPDGSEYFFVETKENDQLVANQLNLFPIIEKHICPVYVVRVKKRG